MQAPVWVQRKYGIGVVNCFTMNPPRPVFDSTMHEFVQEESILHELKDCSERHLVAREEELCVWDMLSLENALDHMIGEDDGRKFAAAERAVKDELRKHAACLITNFQFICCAGPELKDVTMVSSNGFVRCMGLCGAIDNRSVRSHDIETIFRASCKDQWKQRQGEGPPPPESGLAANQEHEATIELSSSKRMKRRNKKSLQKKRERGGGAVLGTKCPQQLDFDGFLLAIVRVALLKFGNRSSSEMEAVKRFLMSNMYVCGQILIQDFRDELLYTAEVYQVLHEHEGLMNTIFQRFCHKHADENKSMSSLLSPPTSRRPSNLLNADRNGISAPPKKGIHVSIAPPEDTQYLSLPEFWDLLTTTQIVVDISTDRRQLNRQEVAWIFRCGLGGRPVPRGLSFPQFLDAISRAALMLAYRNRRINELEAGLESIGVFAEGEATEEILGGENDWDDSSDSDESVDPNSTTVGGDVQGGEGGDTVEGGGEGGGKGGREGVKHPSSGGGGENHHQESLYRHHFDTDNISGVALGKYIHHYLVRPFERFVKKVN